MCSIHFFEKLTLRASNRFSAISPFDLFSSFLSEKFQSATLQIMILLRLIFLSRSSFFSSFRASLIMALSLVGVFFWFDSLTMLENVFSAVVVKAEIY